MGYVFPKMDLVKEWGEIDCYFCELYYQEMSCYCHQIQHPSLFLDTVGMKIRLSFEQNDLRRSYQEYTEDDCDCYMAP